jgi:hypothetical protein
MDKNVEKTILSSKIVEVRNRRPDRHSHSITTHTVPPSLENMFFMEAYTDGSWMVQHSLSSFLLGNSTPMTAGAVVLRTTRGMVTIRVEMDINSKSAFESEVVSLLIAHELSNGRPTNIWTDCEAALKALCGGNRGALNQVIAGWNKNRDINFRKVQAHPERRKREVNWTDQERGKLPC